MVTCSFVYPMPWRVPCRFPGLIMGLIFGGGWLCFFQELQKNGPSTLTHLQRKVCLQNSYNSTRYPVSQVPNASSLFILLDLIHQLSGKAGTNAIAQVASGQRLAAVWSVADDVAFQIKYLCIFICIYIWYKCKSILTEVFSRSHMSIMQKYQIMFFLDGGNDCKKGGVWINNSEYLPW